MAIIRLRRATYAKELVNGYQVINGYEPILFNTDMIIKVSADKEGGSYVQYRESLTNAFNCKETLEEIEALIKENK